MPLVILLVDDERAMREFLAQALEANGYRVLQAVNGREALKVIFDTENEGPNLIISDVMMPLLGGVELCRAVKSNPETAKTPVILMSAAVSKGDSVGAHADAFISKPFDLHALDVLIDSILARPRDSGGETMNIPTSLAHEAVQLAEAPDSVVVQFRYDQQNSGVSRHGHLHAGGQLQIEYDPARLVRAVGTGISITEIVCHVRFQPSGEQQSGALVPQAHPMQRQGIVSRPLIYQVQIPAQTERVEVWFEARASAETTGWDSRYGRNFTFAVADEGLEVPEQSVTLRPNAVVDTARIYVVEDAASKEQVGLGSSGTRLQTALVISAHVSEASQGQLAVWADLHVFDAVGDVLHAASIALEPSAQSWADSELRLWDAEVYPGSGGASGMGVWSRPDAHTINYRLYSQVGDQLFTDGVLHQFEVPADTEVRPIPGGW